MKVTVEHMPSLVQWMQIWHDYNNQQSIMSTMATEKKRTEKAPRSKCYNCKADIPDECEWFDIRDEMIAVGDEFFEGVMSNHGGDDDGDRHEKDTERAKSATRFHLYRHYHQEFGDGGKERVSLPLCVERKIKERYASSIRKYVGYKEKSNKATPSTDSSK